MAEPLSAMANLNLTPYDLSSVNCDTKDTLKMQSMTKTCDEDDYDVDSQDSMRGDGDPGAPSSMSSVDGDDEDDHTHDHNDDEDGDPTTPTANRPSTNLQSKKQRPHPPRKTTSPTSRYRRLPSCTGDNEDSPPSASSASKPSTPTRIRSHRRHRVRTISASETSTTSGCGSVSGSNSNSNSFVGDPSTSAKTPAVIHNWCQRTLYTAGRPPWYDSEGQMKEAFVIGICGASASGKTTVAKNIIGALDVPWVSLVSMDSFYKVLTEEEKEEAGKNNYNFDHPDAFDTELITKTLEKLKAGKRVEIPIYNFKTHCREKSKKAIYGANVVIFEGIMAFVHKSILKLMDMKIYVDTDSDIRLARRLRRDITERGRELRGVLEQYERFVKPAVENFIEPSMMHADIIIPRGGENKVACHLVVQHVHTQLQKRGFSLRSKLRSLNAKDQPLPESFHIIENTPQVKGLHTIIRNHRTNRDEFIFYSQRLMRLLVEHALSMLPYEKVQVTTPQGTRYEGQRAKDHNLCGVSILRAGEVMEPALASVCKDVRLGKILIQTNQSTGEPELHYLRLPKNIHECHVFLMEATVATGAAAMMAIRVLLDHDVPESHIHLLSLLTASPGIQCIAYAFPHVRLVTTALDPAVNEDFHIIPGIGNFGDRYFGTDSCADVDAVDEW